MILERKNKLIKGFIFGGLVMAWIFAIWVITSWWVNFYLFVFNLYSKLCSYRSHSGLILSFLKPSLLIDFHWS